MLRHADIWAAIDALARKNGLSASGLAKRAGLDATTFNRSKRVTRDGKQRWPSTESVAKVLAATGTSLSDFIALVPGELPRSTARRVPVIGYAEAGGEGYFDDAGYPVGSGWDEIVFPELDDPNAYALEVSGESMEPLYRRGDRLVVSPAASIRASDRVVVKTRDGEVMVKELTRRTALKVELRSINPAYEDVVLSPRDIEWIARIVWASQ